MEQTTEPIVVGVRFSKVGKIYNFATDTATDIKVGDQVVVETSRGWQLGQVAQVLPRTDTPSDGLKQIDRRATPRDLLLRQMWQMKEAEVVETCRARAADLNLAGIKIVSAEYSFDGSRLTVLFSSETEEKYDLKSMRSDMQKQFGPSQVEMRQVGPRDVAKVMCGMGACGLETRCCCLFLTEFSSISIRMAKEQGISLTPTEITGMCGRLRCCLIYEYDNYVDARSKLPKRNKRVRTPQGEGKVVDIIPLRGSVLVELPELGVREFPGDEVTLADDSAPQPLPPFQGTKQPSEIDQSITGQHDVTPFTITPEDTETGKPVDKPASGRPPERPGPGRPEYNRPGGRPSESDASRPESSDRPARPGQDRPDRGPRPSDRGDRGRGRPGDRRPPEAQSPSGDQPAGRQQQPPRGGPGGRGPQPDRGAAPGGTEPPTDRPARGPRREGRQGPPREGGNPPGAPGGDRPTGNRPQGNRPQGNRPQGNRPPGNRPPGNQPPGEQPGGGEQGGQPGGQPDKPKSESGGGPGRGGRDSQRRKGRRRDNDNSTNNGGANSGGANNGDNKPGNETGA